MTEQNQDPDDEPTEQETAIPLPERDAMSIIGGPGSLIGVDGGISQDPTTETGTDKIAPRPGYDT
jgi:hypothetical protein